MRPDRVGRPCVRAAMPAERVVRPLAVMLAVCCCLSAASAQWVETTLYLPDTFGGLRMPNCFAYDWADNTVFVAGESTRTILVLDAHDGRRLARIPFEGNIRALCYNSVSNKVYAAAADRNLVAVIDAESRQLLDTIPTGGSPTALEFSPTMNRVYCSNFTSNNVTVIDGEGDSVLATVPVEQQPSAVCWNPTRNVVYCANRGSNTVSVIDAVADTVVATIPAGSEPIEFVYNPELNKLYTANFASLGVTVIDGLADSVLTVVDHGYSPWRLCYNPANNMVYVADELMWEIDCSSDTVVWGDYDVWEVRDVVLDPMNNCLYAAGYYDGVTVIDCAADTSLAFIDFSDARALCVADSCRRVFVAADRDGLIGVIDCADDSLVTAVGTEEQPSKLCVNTNGSKVYCACSGGNEVAVIDGRTNALRAVVPVGTQPTAVLHNAVGNKVYCVNSGHYYFPASVTVIDGLGDSVMRTLEIDQRYGYATGLCLNTKNNEVYVALTQDKSVLVVDASADTTVCRVLLDGYPLSLCYGPAYNYVYVGTDRAVAVIDGELNVIIASVAVGSYPYALCHVSVGAKLYAASSPSGTVSVIAGERPELVAEIDVGSQPCALCWDSKDNKVYCADSSDGNVAVIDAEAETVIAFLPVGGAPCALAYDSLNNYVYCVCRGDSEVAVIDCSRDSVIMTIEVGSEPVAVVWNPVELRTYTANYAGSSVSVIRDSLHVGLAGGQQVSGRKPQATVVRGVLLLNGLGTRSELPGRNSVMSRAVLLDIAGRKVLDLKQGTNDIRRLAPGVYFVVTPSPSPPEGERVGVRRRPASLTKIVVTR
jgi:YVTN family beta-propeller protein